MIRIFTFLVLSFIIPNVYGQVKNDSLKANMKKALRIGQQMQLREFIKKGLTTTQVVPSLSVAVVKDGEVVFTEAFGYADLETKREADTQTSYYIASTTKAYNGLLATLLAEEGLIDLERPITNYKPFKDFERKSVFEGITINDLLSHQSGIDNPYLSFRLAYTGEYSKEEVLKLVEEETQQNETSKAFLYTNFGYYLLDLLLEAELGKSWRDLLEEEVFEPLGMTKTTAYASKTTDLALPHGGVFPERVSAYDLRKTDATMHAAGGLMTTAEDAAKFLQFFLQKHEKTPVLQQTYAQQVEAAHENVNVFEGKGYGRGWRIGEFEGQQVVYHFGGYTGYYAHLSFLPEENTGVAVFANHDLAMPLANLVARYAYHLYGGQSKKLKKDEKLLKKKFPKFLKRQQKAQLAHEKKQAERRWALSLDKSAYAGTYHNPNFGTATIRYEAGKLIVEMGNLKTTATAFPSPDCARVELVPGLGSVVCFDVADGKVLRVHHRREVFERVRE